MERDVARLGVERQPPGIDPPAHRCGVRGGTAQDRLHPHHELAGRERLDDVVVGAQFEAGDPIRLLTSGGNEDHGHTALVADPTTQV
jgi:hypothetical protein